MPYADSEKKKEYMQSWWKKNSFHLKTYRQKTKAHRSETHRGWRVKNLESRRIAMRGWRENPQNRLAGCARSRISNVLRGRIKSAGSSELIGCSWEHLRLWLTFYFQPGMSWANYGKVWHVDHQRPCASFNLTDPAQQRECFHYTNLQPLFAVENLRKGSKEYVW